MTLMLTRSEALDTFTGFYLSNYDCESCNFFTLNNWQIVYFWISFIYKTNSKVYKLVMHKWLGDSGCDPTNVVCTHLILNRENKVKTTYSIEILELIRSTDLLNSFLLRVLPISDEEQNGQGKWDVTGYNIWVFTSKVILAWSVQWKILDIFPHFW